MATEPSAGFVRRTLTVVVIATVALLAVLLTWYAAQVVLTVFAGLLVAVLLRGLSRALATRSGLSSAAALAIVCLTLALWTAATLTFATASISQQLSELIDQLPSAIEQVRGRLEQNPLGARLLAPLSQAQQDGGSLPMSRVMGVASSTLGLVGTTVLILVLGIFLAADPETYRRGVLLLLPPAARPRVADVLDEIGSTLLRWIAGRLVLMAVIGIFTWLGLLLMGVPLALALGLLAGVLNFVPNIGPIVSAVPAMLLAASVNPMLAVWVGAYYLALQSVESYLLEPLIVKKTISVPPATNIAFQLLMGTGLGVMGLTLATPLLAVVTVATRRFYVEDVLGDPQPEG